MASRILQNFARALALAGFVSIALSSPSEATRPVRRTTRPTAARGFSLFAGEVNVRMDVNRVQCNINNIGESCVDPTNSPSLGGGFWPKGSPDQYIFNSGLQIAGIIPGTKTVAFPWPGDTVGAFFFDPRGDQAHGEGRTNVFNALNSADLAAWPTAADVNDTSLFNTALVGPPFGTNTSTRHTVSQQDTWVRFWDGNTNLSNGRQHPMGILVEQRGLAWNFPTGNQDIVYFLYRFINITTTDPTKYAYLANYGYSAQDISDIVAIAVEFQQRSEAAYNIAIPDSGFTWGNLYASFAQDPDVGQAGQNYSNANLVFNIAMAYKSDFHEPTWQFPSAIFSAPFAQAPGFEGVKYLKSPQNIGIAMSGNTTNGAPFPDAVGVQRLWRNLSGNLLATDGSCSFPGTQVARRFCQFVQTAADTRFYESSGPFSMNAGESNVIVVGYIHAAPVASLPAATPGQGSVIPAFSLAPFIGTNMIPGYPVEGSRLISSPQLDTLRNLDRAAGWVNHTDVDGDGIIEQCTRDRGTVPPPPVGGGVAPCITEVTTVPRSLFNKSLVAQAVFDNKFLLPFAPEVPIFFLVPGDNQVTVAWQKSSTETTGDPFFSIAANPASPLYDPNFRQFDVEGYRIWRGRTQSEMQVITSFDYAGTVMNDFTGAFFNTSYGTQCAPELGLNGPASAGPPPVLLTGSCPVNFAAAPTPASPHFAIPLSGDVVQVPPGGRIEQAGSGQPNAARGNVLITVADTAVTGGASGLPALTDNGVPFAYVDHGVQNGFRYFYAVTAFDINSVKSGPSSLESPLVTKSTTPRVPSSNNTPATLIIGPFGDDGVKLDPTADFPKIDPNDGTFNGIIPPTNGGNFGFLASVSEALPPGEYVAKIDSITSGAPASIVAGGEPRMYMTFSAPGVTQHISATIPFPNHADVPSLTQTVDLVTPLVPFDTMRARLVGIPLSFSATATMPARFTGTFEPISGGISATMVCGRALITAANCGTTAVPSRYLLHSRFWDATGVEPPDPTLSMDPSPDHNSGKLTGVTSIFAPFNYRTPTNTHTANSETPAIFRYTAYSVTAFHPADYLITWGAGGAVTVRDSTHHINLPYRPDLGPGYGFISGAAMVAAGVTAANLTPTGEIGSPNPAIPSYQSIYSLAPVCNGTLVTGNGAAIPCARLSQTAVLQQLDLVGAAATPWAPDGVGDGLGIGFVISGQWFFMKMAALPAAGTQWRFRAIEGLGLTATCTPALPASTVELLAPPTDCSNYSYSQVDPVRPPLVPGLQFKMVVAQPFSIAATSGDITQVHTVPDPYYVTNSLEITANTKVLRFVNLPDRAIIRIYSSSGILVSILNHNSLSGGGEEAWNLRNRNNQFVASGVYFYHVEGPDGATKVGRFTVVNYAQ